MKIENFETYCKLRKLVEISEYVFRTYADKSQNEISVLENSSSTFCVISW